MDCSGPGYNSRRSLKKKGRGRAELTGRRFNQRAEGGALRPTLLTGKGAGWRTDWRRRGHSHELLHTAADSLAVLSAMRECRERGELHTRTA